MSDKPKIVYMPGAFNDFDGTQEELDSLIEELESMSTDDFDECHQMSLEELFSLNPTLAVKTAIDMGIFDDLLDEHGNKITDEDIINAVQNTAAPRDKKLH